MSLEIKVPEVGESITEVTIASWIKKDGDFVERDEIIAELESDKATFELPAEASGKLQIKVKEGETIDVGTVICIIDESAKGGGNAPKADEKKSSPTPAKEESSSAPKKTGEVKEMIVPAVGESITEVTISTWLKQEGDFVELDEIIAEVESDKATFELPAEANGLLQIVAKEGDTLEIGATICKIEVMSGAPKKADTSSTSSPESQSTPAQDPGDKSSYAAGHPSPAAAKILSEKGIDPSTIKGTGVEGRITKEDAENAQKSAPAKASTEADAPAAPRVSGSRNERREKMTSLRKTISRRLVSVKNEMAILTTFNEVDMKPIMDLRSKYKEQFKEKHGVGLGFMSFFIKASCEALKEWPAVNASIDENEIIYHDYCDISIAVSSPRGLVVPVIRNAEGLGFQEIESEVIRLAKKARDGKLTIEEMTGGTFTLTNGGIFGSMLSTPIINAPQAAILGMHNIVERAVVINGQVEVRPIMYLALSYDHRLIDGRESVSFLVRLKQLLEDPARLMLGV